MVGSQAGLERKQHGGGGGDLRRRKRGAVGAAVLLGPAARVALFQAGRVRPRQRAWEAARACPAPARRCRRRRRHGSRSSARRPSGRRRRRRAHAAAPPGSRRTARAWTARLRRFRPRPPPAPSSGRRSRSRAAPHPRSRRRSDRSGRGCCREAQVDHLRTGADGPADRARLRARRDRAVVADDLRDEQARGRSEARDPGPVVRQRRDLAGDEGAVPLRVVHGPADEALCTDDPPLQLDVALVDAGVDHRNAHGQQLRQDAERVEGVEGAVLLDVPLALRQRVVRTEAGVRDSRRREGNRRRDQCHSTSHAATTVSTLESPIAKPLPATTRARYAPGVSSTSPEKVPSALTVVRATVAHEPPVSRCSWTAALGSTRSRQSAEREPVARRCDPNERRDGEPDDTAADRPRSRGGSRS